MNDKKKIGIVDDDKIIFKTVNVSKIVNECQSVGDISGKCERAYLQLQQKDIVFKIKDKSYDIGITAHIPKNTKTCIPKYFLGKLVHASFSHMLYGNEYLKEYLTNYTSFKKLTDIRKEFKNDKNIKKYLDALMNSENSDVAMKHIFGKTFIGNIRDFIAYITNNKYFGKVISFMNFIYNKDLCIYGMPDMVCENGLIQIKSNITSMSDFRCHCMQLMLYSLLTGKRNCGIYHPLVGKFFIFRVPSEIFSNFRKFIVKFIKNDFPEMKNDNTYLLSTIKKYESIVELIENYKNI